MRNRRARWWLNPDEGLKDNKYWQPVERGRGLCGALGEALAIALANCPMLCRLEAIASTVGAILPHSPALWLERNNFVIKFPSLLAWVKRKCAFLCLFDSKRQHSLVSRELLFCIRV